VDGSKLSTGCVPIMSNVIHPDFILNVNSPQLISSINIVTIRCPCEKKEILMGQMGLPIPCPSCKRSWFVSAKSQIKVQEVLIDLTQQQVS
jgi:hypothetical protein